MQGQLPPVLCGQLHHAARDAGHLGLVRVDQLQLAVVAGPADAVAGAKLHIRRLIAFQTIGDAARGVEAALMPIIVG